MRLQEPLLIHEVVAEPTLVTEPRLVNLIIVPRVEPVNDPIVSQVHVRRTTGTDVVVTAIGTARTNGRNRFFQKPYPLFETGVPTRQSSYWTNMDGVEGVRVVQRFPRESDNLTPVTSLIDPQLRIFSHFRAETDATHTQNTTFGIIHNMRTDRVSFTSLGFLLQLETALVAADLHIIVLKAALSCLVADGAIDGVMK
jgi:hypothetical protein